MVAGILLRRFLAILKYSNFWRLQIWLERDEKWFLSRFNFVTLRMRSKQLSSKWVTLHDARFRDVNVETAALKSNRVIGL